MLDYRREQQNTHYEHEDERLYVHLFLHGEELIAQKRSRTQRARTGNHQRCYTGQHRAQGHW